MGIRGNRGGERPTPLLLDSGAYTAASSIGLCVLPTPESLVPERPAWQGASKTYDAADARHAGLDLLAALPL